VQLQSAKQRFAAQGLKLAAISYDSPAILKDFADRHGIDFPLLADPNSEILRKFNVLNNEAKGMTKGMAYPGFIYIDAGGVIREKYFTAKYTDRLTANNLIAKLFPELSAEVSQSVEAPHLRLTLAQSDRNVVPGGRVSLIADIELPPDVHVYSPGSRVTSRFNSPCREFQESNCSLWLTPAQKCCTWQPFKKVSRFSRESSASRRMLP
jgi:hypothetical protein